MEFSEVKKYIDTIKDTSNFKELEEFTRMSRIDAYKDMYENIEHYVKVYHAKHDYEKPYREGNEYFEPDYEYFVKFLHDYMNNEPMKMPIRDDGYIDLSNSLYLVQPGIFSENTGNFLDHYIIMTDGSVYISKLPLYYRGNSGVTDKYSLYSSLIASYIAKNLEVECADIALAKKESSYRIISKSFLKENEEIVTYTEDMEQISEYLEQMDEALRLRQFDESEIEKAKFEFIKQEFIAKLIGLKDQTADNSPLIVNTDDEGNRHVRMAPMFDLDYSFQIASKFNFMTVRKCDNGKDDIASLIEQYKDYPGFKEFAKKSLETLDMSKIFKQIYEKTGLKEFSESNNDEKMKQFSEFVTKNLQIAKETYAKVFKEERDDR